MQIHIPVYGLRLNSNRRKGGNDVGFFGLIIQKEPFLNN